MTTSLARRAGEAPNSTAVGVALAGLWAEIEVVLHPIIGRRGLTALFRRSAHVGSNEHPFLAPLNDGVADAVDHDTLVAVLSSQSVGDALGGGSRLLELFCELLSTLIGSDLTEHLLHSVWSSPSSGASAQDISHDYQSDD